MDAIDPAKIFLTPNITFEKFSKAPSGDVNVRIELYADYVEHAMLAQAEVLAKNGLMGGFASLAIVLTYFEGFWAFKTGLSRVGGKGFVRGFVDAFPPSVYEKSDPGLTLTQAEIAEDVAKRMYSGARCGLYHVGFVKAGIFCTSEIIDSISIKHPMEGYEHLPTVIAINPRVFVADVQDHFDAYIKDLRDRRNAALRDNFLKVFRTLES